jgi:hypothetical protein
MSGQAASDEVGVFREMSDTVAEKGWPLLCVAARRGYADICRELLQRSANPDATTPGLFSPLSYFCFGFF